MQRNEVCETGGLLSCHVCIVVIKNLHRKYIIVSHYQVTNTNEHVCKIRSILQSCIGASQVSEVNITLFRLAPEKIKEHHASEGNIYHVDKYESNIALLKNRLLQIFPNANISEVPYYVKKKDGDWVKVNARKGTWVSSFGSGFIENGMRIENKLLRDCSKERCG
jgi:hypothetical protein